jgi:cyclophilin family peptidyl-prolyl cis-trans isomerase
MMRFLATFGLVGAVLLSVSCGRRPLKPEEWQRNEIFAEILHREDTRTLGEDDFFPLHLRASDPQVQQWCARALGRIGNPHALPWLYEALHSTYSDVRAEAAFAIGETEDRNLLQNEGRDADPRTRAALEPLLNDAALLVRARTVEAFGKIGNPADALKIVALVDRFSYDRSAGPRLFLNCAITALMRLNDRTARPLLIRLAELNDPEIQWRVANAFYRMRDPEARPLLEKLLDSVHTDVQAHAAQALGICGDPSLEARLKPFLMPEKDGKTVPLAVRISALQALVNLKSPRAADDIEQALAAAPSGLSWQEQQDQLNFSTQAATALGSAGSERNAQTLVRLARAGGAVADNALIALARIMNESAGKFFDLLPPSPQQLASGPHAWAAAMGELGGERAQLELKRMLIENTEGGANTSLQTPAILKAMARAQMPDLNGILSAFFNSHDGYILRSLLDVYAPDVHAVAPWKSLIQMYGNLAQGSDQETKVALIDKLTPWLDSAEVRSFLPTLLNDRERNVRIAAIRMLRKAGLQPGIEEAGPATTLATMQTYTQAAAARQERTLAILETDRGTMEIELFRQDAPLTVANFISLAKSKEPFFNGLSFMRVVPYFVIQGGDPRNDQEGGPGYSIRCEINTHPFERGSVGMALSGKDTGGSQFFITLSPQPHLDGAYTCFGRVISGMSVAEHMTAGDRIRTVRIKEEKTLFDSRRY